jgi:hypothetical protein
MNKTGKGEDYGHDESGEETVNSGCHYRDHCNSCRCDSFPVPNEGQYIDSIYLIDIAPCLFSDTVVCDILLVLDPDAIEDHIAHDHVSDTV